MYLLCEMFKVAVVTPITDLRQYLTHLSTQTNMKLLTTDVALGRSYLSIFSVFQRHIY